MSTTSGGPQPGRPRLPGWARLVRADNPSPMTLEGTNTYVLRAPGAVGPSGSVVVDPGPLDDVHLAAVAATGPVELVLLTHGHPDHAEGAGLFHEMTGAPVAALDPTLVRGGERLAAGARLAAAGLSVRVVATPGHTADSVCLAVDGDEPAVLTGDTVLGRGTTVVAHPDGRLRDYLSSLSSLRDLAAEQALVLLPGHGPAGGDLGTAAQAYLAHRAQRLDEVRAALAAGASTPREVVEVVYAAVDRALWPAAELSVRAQLAYLEEEVSPPGG